MEEDPERPKLTVVATNDDLELRKRDACDRLRWPTREMAANLLRVARGAGKPWLLPQQIIDLSEAILEAAEVSNAWGIWSVMEEVLQSGLPHYDSDYRDADYEIAKGALQLVASRLVHQSAQQAAGRREISDGIRSLELERERARREAEQYARQWRDEQRQREKRPRRAKSPRRKPAKKAAPPPSPVQPTIEPEQPFKGSTAEFMKMRKAQLARDQGEDA